MFTGIIETLGVIKKIHNKGSNVDFVVESSLAAELKIDQSLAHNGVCLTIVALSDNEHTVTAIDEFKSWQFGEFRARHARFGAA